MRIIKKAAMSKICLFVIMIMILLAGCNSTSYRITPKKDYNDFDSDFDFLDSSTKQTISELMKSAVDWYNSVEIPEDYSAVDIDVFASIPFSDYGEQLMQMNEEHDYRSGSDEGMRYLHATSPATSITGTIWGITVNNNVEVTVGSDSDEKIEVSEDDWINIKNKITDALDFYYGDGDRSTINMYAPDTTEEDESAKEDSQNEHAANTLKSGANKATCIMIRDTSFKESTESKEFDSIQQYLDYIGSVTDYEKLYLPEDIERNRSSVFLLGQEGTFTYGVNGTPSRSGGGAIDYVLYGEWKTNASIDEEQCKNIIGLLDKVYGEHEVLFSDGSVIEKVEGIGNYDGKSLYLRWQDVKHYDDISISFSNDKRIKITWFMNNLNMIGFEPVIAANKALNHIGIKKENIQEMSYVDISDRISSDDVLKYMSSKAYIIKTVLKEKINGNGTVYLSVIVLIDDSSTRSCYVDTNVDDSTLIQLYGQGELVKVSTDELMEKPGNNDLVEYKSSNTASESLEESKQDTKENTSTNNQTGNTSKQDNNNSPYKTNKCLVCGNEATHSMTGIASGELEWYCDAHWKTIQDTIGGMEKDVGESNASKHQCQAPGCSKEGTNRIEGISGEYEYYCTEHYQEMVDLYNKMVNGSK